MNAGRHLYQRTREYFGQLAAGMEECGAAELAELGATGIKTGYLGVYFKADQRTAYSIVYQTRIFSRILAPLVTFDCPSEKHLYKLARKIEWKEFLTLTKTFAIVANVTGSGIRNSQYAGQVLKDAIVDQFRDLTGERPSVDTRNPNLLINLHIQQDKARISIDLGGGSLHKRGYRVESVEAPMQETLAATLIRMSGWKGERPLYDPFCGSGTLLCEAFMKQCGIPAAYLRKRFGLLRLPDFNATVWNQVKTETNAGIQRPEEGLFKGSDISAEALKAARANRATLPEGGKITVRRQDFRQLEGLSNTTIVTNPPYGIRLGSTDDASILLKDFGDFLKQKCTGSSAFIYYGEASLVKKLGLKPEWKHAVRSGGLDGVFCKYELY